MKDIRGGKMKYDVIEKLGDSIIQHGKFNDRIYLMHIGNERIDSLLIQLEKLAQSKKYSKIFAKVPDRYVPLFYREGYFPEAFIPGFFKNEMTVFFMSRFLTNKRQIPDVERFHPFKELLDNRQHKKPVGKLKKEYKIKQLTKKDAAGLSQLYRHVFETYPFPIHDPGYISETMDTHIHYFGVFYDHKIIAASSAETDKEDLNAEMTDFAVYPEYGGNRFAYHLLDYMEEKMKTEGMKTLYTIARLNSLPMNKTFINKDYRFAGTLINNTNISGSIESMNVYYKHI
jgi:beta-lysine N6-acetyltransferase